jgi:hypothetical protein
MREPIRPRRPGSGIDKGEPKAIAYGNPWTGEGRTGGPIKPAWVAGARKEKLADLRANRTVLEQVPTDRIAMIFQQHGFELQTQSSLEEGPYASYVSKYIFQKDGQPYEVSGTAGEKTAYGKIFIDWKIFGPDGEDVYGGEFTDLIDALEQLTQEVSEQTSLEFPYDPRVDTAMELEEAVAERLTALREETQLPQTLPTPPGIIWEPKTYRTGRFSVHVGDRRGYYIADASVALPGQEQKVTIGLPVSAAVFERDRDAIEDDPQAYVASLNIDKELPVRKWEWSIAPDGRVLATPLLYSDEGEPGSSGWQLNFPPIEVARLPVEPEVPVELARRLGLKKNTLVSSGDAQAFRKELKAMAEKW